MITTRNERILSTTFESPALLMAVGNATRIFAGKLEASAMMNALTSSTKKKFCSTFARLSTMTSAKSAIFQLCASARMRSGSMSTPRSLSAPSPSRMKPSMRRSYSGSSGLMSDADWLR